jgi:hypothetical protein
VKVGETKKRFTQFSACRERAYTGSDLKASATQFKAAILEKADQRLRTND